jgi:hypothetical protein
VAVSRPRGCTAWGYIRLALIGKAGFEVSRTRSQDLSRKRGTQISQKLQATIQLILHSYTFDVEIYTVDTGSKLIAHSSVDHNSAVINR